MSPYAGWPSRPCAIAGRQSAEIVGAWQSTCSEAFASQPSLPGMGEKPRIGGPPTVIRVTNKSRRTVRDAAELAAERPSSAGPPAAPKTRATPETIWRARGHWRNGRDRCRARNSARRRRAPGDAPAIHNRLAVTEIVHRNEDNVGLVGNSWQRPLCRSDVRRQRGGTKSGCTREQTPPVHLGPPKSRRQADWMVHFTCWTGGGAQIPSRIAPPRSSLF